MPPRLSILLVEDDDTDAKLLEHELRAAGFDPAIRRSDCEKSFLRGLEPPPDLILSDMSLPGFSGLAALRLLRERRLDIPFIVVSGTINDQEAVELVFAGAVDYLLKSNMTRFGTAVRRALEQKHLRDKTRLAEERMAELAAIIETTNDAVFTINLDGNITTWNASAERLYGRTVRESLGCSASILASAESADDWKSSLAAALNGFTVSGEEVIHRHSDGRAITVSLTISPLSDLKGAISGASVIARDVTEEKRTERQLAVSEERLRMALEAGPMGTFDWSIAEDRLYWSPQQERLYGLGPGEFEGRYQAFLRRVHPEDAGRVDRELSQALATGTTVASEFRILWPDGSVHWVADQRSVTRDVLGKPVRVIGFSKDVTASRQLEVEMRLRDRALQAIAQGILITDARKPDNPIIYANEGFLTLTGYSRDEVLGKNCRFLQRAATDPAVVDEIRCAILEERSTAVEILNYRKDDQPFWNSLSVSPVRDECGQVTHFVGVQMDVTARRSLEEKYRQAQKMEAIGRLSAGIAHDFNNILSVVTGYASHVLNSLEPSSPLRRDIQVIMDAGERAEKLTGRLLAFGRPDLSPTKITDVRQLLANVEGFLRHLVGPTIELVLDTTNDLWKTKIDAVQFEQVMMNLAVNARDAMPNGGKLTIRSANAAAAAIDKLQAGMEGDHIAISVEDTGEGMDEPTKQRLFEPFFTSKGSKGTGMGLATVYSIVKQALGHIEVDSTPGAGSTFTIYLPALNAGEAPIEIDSACPASAAP